MQIYENENKCWSVIVCNLLKLIVVDWKICFVSAVEYRTMSNLVAEREQVTLKGIKKKKLHGDIHELQRTATSCHNHWILFSPEHNFLQDILLQPLVKRLYFNLAVNLRIKNTTQWNCSNQNNNGLRVLFQNCVMLNEKSSNSHFKGWEILAISEWNAPIQVFIR